MKYSDTNKPIQCFQTNSTWYKGAKRNSKPVGILWHDTAGGNPNISRYVQPFETDANYAEMIALLGKNKYGNDWNHIEHEAGLNAWIGKLADGTIATVQTGEWDIHPWGCGGGTLGSCNGYIKKDGKTTWTNEHWIQFEICDDNYGKSLGTKEYFDSVYKEACEFTAYICHMYNIDPLGTYTYNGVEVPTILCHADSHTLKLGGNHGDVYSWFKVNNSTYVGGDKTLEKTMDTVRNDVAKILAEYDKSEVSEPVELVDYSVFKAGTLVSLSDDAVYYSGSSVPNWVKSQNWYVYQDAKSDRVVINKSESGENSIMSPINACYLTIVSESADTKDSDDTDSTVKIITETYSGVPSTGSAEDEKKIWDFLLDKIGNEFGVAGIMGNLYAESGLRSNNLQNSYEKKLNYTDTAYTEAVDNGTYTNFVKDSAGYGLAQWTYYSRKQLLIDYAKSCKKSIGDLQMQLEFLYNELSTNYKKSVYTTLLSASSVKEASDIVLVKFEAPASKDTEETQTRRASYSQKYYDAYHKIADEPVTENDTPINDGNDEQISEPVNETVTPDIENPAVDNVEENIDEQNNNEKETEQNNKEPEAEIDNNQSVTSDDTDLAETQKTSIVSIIMAIIKFIKKLFSGNSSDK